MEEIFVKNSTEIPENFTGKVIYQNCADSYFNGLIEYCVNGDFHREDGPAVIWPDGGKDFFLYGQPILKEDFLKVIPNEQIIDAIWNMDEW